MALLWVWKGENETTATPMIEHPVGEGQFNEMSDVYLVQALLNIIYSHSVNVKPPGFSQLPKPGMGWDDLTTAYVMDYQAQRVRQKKRDGIVSLPPAWFTRMQAMRHKYTINCLLNDAEDGTTIYEHAGLLDYLKSRYPLLIVPFSRMRNGTSWIEPSSGIYEDARSGGSAGKVSERKEGPGVVSGPDAGSD